MVSLKKITAQDPLFNQVVQLGDANSKTLGHFPEGALMEYANKGQVIVSFEGTSLLGYVLFAVTQKKSRIRLVHLCIDETHRGKEIAKTLLDYIVSEYSNILRGISLSCREDYKVANKFWKRYGFKPLDRVRSRSKKERYLKKWWFDFGNPDMFDMAMSKSQKAKVLLDTNIIIKLRDQDKKEDSGSRYLLADWIADEADYYFASEIYNEIDGDTDKNRATITRNYLSNFNKVITSPKEVNTRYEQLLDIVKGQKENDLSDKKQLAECISGGLEYFITTDQNILNHEEILYEYFNISVLSPSEFILMIDKIVNSINYNSSRLAGSLYQYREIESSDLKSIISKFSATAQGEKESSFRDKLTVLIGDRQNVKTKIVHLNEELFAIWIAKILDTTIQINFLRINSGKLSNSLFDQLISSILELTLKEGKNSITIEEEYISEENVISLGLIGFKRNGKVWQKSIYNKIIESKNILQLANNEKERVSLSETIINFEKENNPIIKVAFEKQQWPLKFSDLEIPTYIIPIKPLWASQLFDYYEANSMIFGSKAQLVWNRENIYYRSVNPVSEKVPARILWYVSSANYKTDRAKAIVATSYLDEVILGEAKALYKEQKAFGIYQWKDIYKLAKNDANSQIKALKFSNTEVFKNPIPLNKIDKILIANQRKSNTFASPLEVNNKIFNNIYTEGKYG